MTLSKEANVARGGRVKGVQGGGRGGPAIRRLVKGWRGEATGLFQPALRATQHKYVVVIMVQNLP